MPYYSQLPEVTAPSSHFPASSVNESEKMVKVNPNSDTDKIALNSVEKRRFDLSRKRLYWILGVVILVVIAAVVGSVVGVLVGRNKSRASEGTSAGSDNAQEGNATDSNGSEDLIWNQTSLAVTGWRYNDEKDFSIRLFYQDEGGYLRVSAMESTSKENWTPGTKIVKAKQGTPLAAACNNQSIYEPKKSVRRPISRSSKLRY
jgi:hypothetical protein